MNREERKGFSLWLDFIERDFLQKEFERLIEEGTVCGATSNPSIFAQAIGSSPAYKEALKKLEGLAPKAKYEALAVEDIRLAARKLREIYDEGDDGYISLEVDPFLANDTRGTLEEARRLFKEIDAPNVMIKVPATEAGYPVMRELLADGISVNATLIFSPAQARACLDAMKAGIDEFESTGGIRVEGVISVFVSRFDRMLDPILEEKGLPTARTGIMNAAKIYAMIEANRTPSIRTLFASTGVKAGQSLPADYYIRELYAPHAVNTAPLETIRAYVAGGEPQKSSLPLPAEEIDAYFQTLEEHGIEMDRVYRQLMEEGVEAFQKAFETLLVQLERS